MKKHYPPADEQTLEQPVEQSETVDQQVTLQVFTQKLKTIIKEFENSDIELELEQNAYFDEIPLDIILKQMQSRFTEALSLAAIGISNQWQLSAFNLDEASLEKHYAEYITAFIFEYKQYIRKLKALFNQPNNLFQELQLYKTWEESHQLVLKLFAKDPSYPSALMKHYPLIYSEMAHCCIESVSLLNSSVVRKDPFFTYFRSLENKAFDKIDDYLKQHEAIINRPIKEDEGHQQHTEKYQACLIALHAEYADDIHAPNEDMLDALRTFDFLFVKLNQMAAVLFRDMYEDYIAPPLSLLEVARKCKGLISTITGMLKHYATALFQVAELQKYVHVFLRGQSKNSTIQSTLVEYHLVCYRSSYLLKLKKVAIQNKLDQIIIWPIPNPDDEKQKKDEVQNKSDPNWTALSNAGNNLVKVCNALLKSETTKYQKYMKTITKLDLFSKEIAKQSKIHKFETKKIKALQSLINSTRVKLVEKAAPKQASVDDLIKNKGIGNSTGTALMPKNNQEAQPSNYIAKLKKNKLKKEKKAKQASKEKQAAAEAERERDRLAEAEKARLDAEAERVRQAEKARLDAEAERERQTEAARLTAAENDRKIEQDKKAKSEVAQQLKMPSPVLHHYNSHTARPLRHYFEEIKALYAKAYQAISASRGLDNKQFSWESWNIAKNAFQQAYIIALKNKDALKIASAFRRYDKHLKFAHTYASEHSLHQERIAIENEIKEITGLNTDKPGFR